MALGRNMSPLAAVAVVVLNTLQIPATLPIPPAGVQEHLRQIARDLPLDSVLRHQLEDGAHGDGVAYPWMDAMKRAGVKRTAIEVNFTWHRGLHDLKVARVMFFTSYEGPDSQVTDPEKLNQFERDGLQATLEQVGLDRARHGWWFESPEHQHPAKRGRVAAGAVILLYDDPSLPVPPPLYGTRDPSLSPLEQVASIGDRAELKRLLTQDKLKPGDLDKALVWAAAGDDSEIVHWLIAAGARVDSGELPLTAAIANWKIANVKLLLEAGADPNARDKKNDETPLMLAMRNNLRDSTLVVKLLLAARADVNVSDKYRRTALFTAIWSKQPVPVLQALLAAGANVNAQGHDGNTPLIDAVSRGDIQAVKALLVAHAEVHARNRKGETALSIAVENHRSDILALLKQ